MKPHDWLKRLLRWLQGFRRERRSVVRVVGTWTSNLGTLHRIERGTDGAVATYRFLPQYTGRYDLLLTLDRAQWATNRKPNERRPFNPRGTEPSWHVALTARQHPTPTHLIALVEISRFPDSATKSIRVRVRKAYLVDFVGIRVFDPPDHWGKIILAKIAAKLLSVHDDEIDLEDLIDTFAYKYVQSNHSCLVEKK